ncbi:GGDEF domain-containing protein [Oceanospirillum sediminis]|uniref:diguanylate cyclase n=1 Tax=Oceanospirillum sediminis TaxID=2760088 RepID=A0A839IQQ4_9GAMM|nr:GGDEF domain-containing protein [Oceanospirillum sediminis]
MAYRSIPIRLRLLSRKILRLITGRSDDIFMQVHHGFCLLTALFVTSAGLFNVLLDITSLLAGVAMASFGCGLVAIWYFSRFRGHYREMATLFSLTLLFVVIPMNWFSNAGSLGPTALYCLTAALYTLSVLREVAMLRKPVVFLAFAEPLILYLLEQRFPHWVSGYTSPEVRFWDMQFSYIAAMVILFITAWGHLHRYKAEAERSRQYAQYLKHMADRDGLTSLYNHRAILERAGRIRKEKPVCSLILCDVDFFKRLNDTYGHLIGDTVLIEVATHLQNTAFEAGALAGRYGGEEFLLVCSAPHETAMTLAEQARSNIATRVTCPEQVTISIGVAQCQDNESLADTLHRADQALYRAKEQGRNRVEPASATDAASNLVSSVP